MPNLPTKASRLQNACQDFRWHVRKHDLIRAQETAREIEEIGRDFEQFAKDYKFILDRWQERTG